MSEVKKTTNYTADQVTRLCEMYASLGNEGLDQIAKELGKSVRSVRSKLVREGVYVASPKPVTVKKNTGPTKKELLNQLEDLVGFSVTSLQGSTKEGLLSLIEFAKNDSSRA